MAKALLGYMSSDRSTIRHTVERLVADNQQLRRQVAELEARLERLQTENAELSMTSAAALLEPLEEMQPA